MPRTAEGDAARGSIPTSASANNGYNSLKLSVKSRMKMQLEQRRQAMLQLHLSDDGFDCLLRFDLY